MCVCVCTCVCAHVCMCTCVYVHMCMCAPAYNVDSDTRACIYTCTNVHAAAAYTFVYCSICKYIVHDVFEA